MPALEKFRRGLETFRLEGVKRWEGQAQPTDSNPLVGKAGPLGAKRCSWVVTHAHTLVTGFAAFEALPRLVRFPEIRALLAEPDP